METNNGDMQIDTDPNNTLTKPSLNKHVIYGFLLSWVITLALAIPLMTTIFQIRLAKYNIKIGKDPKVQWRSAILNAFLVFAITAIVVICALMRL